jgi:hypothetical protein
MRILCAVAAALLPGIVLQVGARIAVMIAGRVRVRQLLANLPPADRKPLNMRIGGYDAAAVHRHWQPLDADAFRREERFLRLDLVLPVLFTAAFAYSLPWMVEWAGYDWRPAYSLPVVGLLLADWTENLTTLGQLRRYAAGGASALQPERIRVASTATRIKLVLFAGMSLLLLALLAIGLARALTS